MQSLPPSPAPQPSPENFGELNQRFYDAEPWSYFHLRLAHLLLVAGDSDRYRALLSAGLTAGTVELTIKLHERAANQVPTAEQAYVAVEIETLLHHSAETLLRLVHAHAEADPCPWLRMSRVRSAAQFKSWVERMIAKADQSALADLVTLIIACDARNAAEVEAIVAYLRLLARHFLDAGSYNAAKHGMAVRGSSNQMKVEIDDHAWIDARGPTIRWLARWPLDAAERPTRWTEISRVFSLEAAVGLIKMTTDLMRAVWVRARQEHLGEEVTELLRPPHPDELFAAVGLRHPVVIDFFEPLRYEGDQERDIVMQSRHFRAPSPSDRAAAENDPPNGSG